MDCWYQLQDSYYVVLHFPGPQLIFAWLFLLVHGMTGLFWPKRAALRFGISPDDPHGCAAVRASGARHATLFAVALFLIYATMTTGNRPVMEETVIAALAIMALSVAVADALVAVDLRHGKGIPRAPGFWLPILGHVLFGVMAGYMSWTMSRIVPELP